MFSEVHLRVILSLLILQLLVSRLHEVLVVSAIRRQLALVQVDDVSGDGVEELSVVRNNEKNGGPTLQVIFKPDDGFHVQHVRRFVQ